MGLSAMAMRAVACLVICLAVHIYAHKTDLLGTPWNVTCAGAHEEVDRLTRALESALANARAKEKEALLNEQEIARLTKALTKFRRPTEPLELPDLRRLINPMGPLGERSNVNDLKQQCMQVADAYELQESNAA